MLFLIWYLGLFLRAIATTWGSRTVSEKNRKCNQRLKNVWFLKILKYFCRNFEVCPNLLVFPNCSQRSCFCLPVFSVFQFVSHSLDIGRKVDYVPCWFFNSIMGLTYCVCSVIMIVMGSNLACFNKIELLIFLSPIVTDWKP